LSHRCAAELADIRTCAERAIAADQHYAVDGSVS